MNAGGSTLPKPQYLVRPDGAKVAYRHIPGNQPTVVFLSGYASHMGGTKAVFLLEHCMARGQAYLCLDYRGHGQSDGDFEDGTIGDWCDDARAVLSQMTEGPLVLVGSSMGGWMMLLLARYLPERMAGLVGVAAAPDFTSDLARSSLSDEERRTLARDGVVYRRSEYGPECSPLTAKLLAEGQLQLVLTTPLVTNCPVRLVHGLQDSDVPWERALRIAECVTSRDVRIELLKSGGHRLSEPHELALIARVVDEVLERTGNI